MNTERSEFKRDMICTLEPTKKKGDGDTHDGTQKKPESASNKSPQRESDEILLGNDSASSKSSHAMMGAGEATSEAAQHYTHSNKNTNAATLNVHDTSVDVGDNSDHHDDTKAKQRASITSLCAESALNMEEDPIAWQTTIADCGKHLDYYETSRLRVGIIIHTTETSHRALTALASPASSCKVTALAVLKPPPSFSRVNLAELHHQLAEHENANNSTKGTAGATATAASAAAAAAAAAEKLGQLTPGSIMRQWMHNNNLGNHSESVAVLGGEEGARQIVQRDDVDAVFLIVPDE